MKNKTKGENDMGVNEKIQNGDYKVRIEYPVYPENICRYCNAGKIGRAEFCPKCGAKTCFDERMEKYRQDKGVYHAEEGRLNDQFRNDAMEECGLSGHPKEDKVWMLAWERGHSAGLEEVFLCIQELAELVL
jgi:ribosomal protein L40E